MTLAQNVLRTNVGHDADARIEELISMMTERDFEELKSTLQERFGLEYEEADSHPHNIKTIITGKKIVFSKSVSPSSRTFMVLHSLGHYYFICEAKRKNIERYAYIYDLRGVQSALHYYETEGQSNALDTPPEMTVQRRKDRVSFEVGANNFAIDLLSRIGFERGADLIKRYEIGDINYILDVSRGGKSAIVPTDRDYLRQYVCAGLSINPEDTYDDGVYCPESFDTDAIDWQYIQDIKLEIHFF
jgi:hypothetical protein